MGQTESKKQAMRWFLDLCIDGLTVVGKVHQLPVPEEERVHGAVRQQGKWQAAGMKVSWGDTDLGQHGRYADAKKAVETWHQGMRKVEAQTMRLPCAVHYKFRPECVMCEKANEPR